MVSMKNPKSLIDEPGVHNGIVDITQRKFLDR